MASKNGSNQSGGWLERMTHRSRAAAATPVHLHITITGSAANTANTADLAEAVRRELVRQAKRRPGWGTL